MGASYFWGAPGLKNLEKTEVGATGALERLPERSRSPRNGPRSVAGALGTAARARREPSGQLPERSGSPRNGFKRAPRAFGTASRALREPSERLQERAESPRSSSRSSSGALGTTPTLEMAALRATGLLRASMHLRATVQNTAENAVRESCSARLNSHLQASGESAPCMLCTGSTLVYIYIYP